jgi:RNA polymerase sigma-70 factor (ECF subfamily)
MHPSDTELLVERVMDGDLDAYGDIVLRHQSEVWAVVSALLLNRGEAEDLVQEVFVSAYRHLGSYERGRDFSAWITAIARNRVRNEMRRRGRELHRLAFYHTERAIEFSHAPIYEEQQKRLTTALDRCLGALPEPHTS